MLRKHPEITAFLQVVGFVIVAAVLTTYIHWDGKYPYLATLGAVFKLNTDVPNWVVDPIQRWILASCFGALAVYLVRLGNKG